MGDFENKYLILKYERIKTLYKLNTIEIDNMYAIITLSICYLFRLL